PGTSKQRKAKEFRENKDRAKQLYGTSVCRPQEQYPDFLRARRAYLYALESYQLPKVSEIDSYVLVVDHPENGFIERQAPVTIDTSTDFDDMMTVLETQHEFIIDTESHQDKSIIPFITTLQITTPTSPEYIVYVPSVYGKIVSDLAPLLQK
ncbi:unnamed protein product, partial [Allacma fusca]